MTPSKPSVLFPISASTTRKEAATAAVGLEESRDIDSLHLEGMSVLPIILISCGSTKNVLSHPSVSDL